MTQREINEAVARKLKGWFSKCKCEFPVETAHHNCPAEFGNCHHADNCNLPDYCGSIAEAWEIVEWCGNKDFDVTIHLSPAYSSGSSEFGCAIANECWNAVADTAPRAICLAFLKLP